MQPLADFRIENDSVVMLSFASGDTYRVSPKDLERYLQEEDLRKVQKAIKLRRQFMRRILPPTALFVMGLAIIGLGSYDYHRIMDQPASSQGGSASHALGSPVVETANPTMVQPVGVSVFDTIQTTDDSTSASGVQPAGPVSEHNGSDEATEHASPQSFQIQGEPINKVINQTQNTVDQVEKLPGTLVH